MVELQPTAAETAATGQDHESRIRERGSGRLEALSDGIFAFAMTLLVLNLKPPSPGLSTDQLLSALAGLGPGILCYAISFALLGVYWSGQAAQYQYVRKVDQAYTWITIGFLAIVVLVPFSTSLLSEYPDSLIAIWAYGANLVLIGVMLFWLWAHATGGCRLVDRNLPAGVIRYAKWRSLLAPACYLAAMLAAVVSPALSLAVFTLTPLLYILPGLHRYWLKLIEKEKP